MTIGAQDLVVSDLRPLSFYAREVRPQLPAEAFQPVRNRIAFLVVHLALIATGIFAVAHSWGGRWMLPVWSILIGHSFAGAAFVGHETLHGAVVRGATARNVLGWFSFLSFALSPRLWVAWHNKTHHHHTMEESKDPDAYPTLREYEGSLATRVADRLSFGRGRFIGSLFTLFLGFTGQSTQMMWRWSKKYGLLDRHERRMAILETVLGWAVWIAVAVWLGPAKFVFAYLIPLMIGNAIVIGYILTNHSLSPYTAVNDPLVNTLTVTVPRPFAWLHLQFGLHVEHHLFPSMSSHYAPAVRAQLQARWPERYQSMTLAAALWRLFRTPRVYLDEVTLYDPADGFVAPTLQPGPGADAGAGLKDAA